MCTYLLWPDGSSFHTILVHARLFLFVCLAKRATRRVPRNKEQTFPDQDSVLCSKCIYVSSESNFTRFSATLLLSSWSQGIMSIKAITWIFSIIQLLVTWMISKKYWLFSKWHFRPKCVPRTISIVISWLATFAQTSRFKFGLGVAVAWTEETYLPYLGSCWWMAWRSLRPEAQRDTLREQQMTLEGGWSGKRISSHWKWTNVDPKKGPCSKEISVWDQQFAGDMLVFRGLV